MPLLDDRCSLPEGGGDDIQAIVRRGHVAQRVTRHCAESIICAGLQECGEDCEDGENEGRPFTHLTGDSSKHGGHGIPNLRDDSEQLEDKTTADDKSQQHWEITRVRRKRSSCETHNSSPTYPASPWRWAICSAWASRRLALFRAWRPRSSRTFRSHGVVAGFEPVKVLVKNLRGSLRS